MLFTYIFVRSRPDSNEGVKCEIDPLEQTARYWMGQDKQEPHLERETSRRLSLSLDQGHEGHIREVLREDGCSSMYKLYHLFLPV